MTCQELSQILSERSLASLPSDLRAAADAHLAECSACRSLVETIDGINRMPVPQSLFAPPEDMAPVRPMPSQAWFIAIAFVLPAVLTALVVMVVGAGGWKAMPSDSAWLFSILAAAGLAALVIGFYRQFKPGARETLDGQAAIGILFVGCITYSAVEFGWNPPHFDTTAHGAWVCLRFGTLVAIGTSIALLVWARLGFASNPLSASFWTGALASMAGLIALGLHCPNRELSHVLLGHVTVILAGSYLAAWMARRFFGLR